MNNKLFQIRSWISYWLDAVNAHSLHSPFLFDVYTNVIRKEEVDPSLTAIEEIRKHLLSDSRSVDVLDLGAGSERLRGNKRVVSAIARTSLSSQKYSSLYRRLIRHFQCKEVLELGTSLGINTLYLAAPGTRVVSFEGSPAIAGIASEVFQHAGISTIRIVEGDIAETLPSYLQTKRRLDFAFLDANHRYHPTLEYFNHLTSCMHPRSILILDDIHYSEEMDAAWRVIKEDALVCGTIDLYRCGIVLFEPSLNKQHVVLQF